MPAKYLAWEAARLAAEKAQLEQRQARYRSQYGAKVTSLVAAIDGSLAEARTQVDGAIDAQQGLEGTLQAHSFWGEVPRWYADSARRVGSSRVRCRVRRIMV